MKEIALFLTDNILSLFFVPVLIFFLAFFSKKKDKISKWIKFSLIFIIGKFCFSVLYLYFSGYIKYRNFEIYLVIYLSAFILGYYAGIYSEVLREKKEEKKE